MPNNKIITVLRKTLNYSWQEEKGTTEDEMVGWHHRLNGPEFEEALGVGDGQRRVVSSAYLRLLIFLPAILIPACASSSPAFLMMYSA